MKKSYLSRQLVAVIVIATVLLVSIPLYFFVLVPFLQRGDDQVTVSEPLIEGEAFSGTNVRIIRVNEKITDSHPYTEYTIGKGAYSWNLRSGDGYISVVGYENTPFSDGMYYLKNAVSSPVASERVLPTAEELHAIRDKKAKELKAEELEQMGGIGHVFITAEDLKDYQINWADYGLDNKDELNYFTVTDSDGVKHTVYIGGTAADGSSRYAMYEGRNAVYLLSGAISEFMCKTVEQIARPLVIQVPDTAQKDYTPDSFVVYREGKETAGAPYVRIEKLSAEQALLLDRATVSLLVEYVGEEGKEDEATASDYNYYDTSSAYMQMLSESFRKNIEGSEVVVVTPSYAVVEQGKTIYKQDPIAKEVLEQYFINKDNPYRSFYYSKNTDAGALVNLAVFSKPQTDEEGKSFYYVYNANYEMIVKLYASALPTIGVATPVNFVEADYSNYLNKYISTLPLLNIVGLKVDSIALPDAYAALMPRVKDEFTLRYQMNATGDDRVLDSKKEPILQDVLQADGTVLKTPSGVSSADNFKEMYARLVTVRMYTNVGLVIDQINATDLSKPHVTITYEMYKGGSHTLNFYMFDASGTYAFYTYDGQGKYVVYREDVTKILQAVECLQKGESVKEVLGDAF